MTKAQSIESIEAALGVSWEDIVAHFDKAGGRELLHPTIASIAYEFITSHSSAESPGWWSQAIAVAYEQQIGRRQPGQKADGTYESSATRTIAGNRDATFHRLSELLNEPYHQGLVCTEVRTSTTPKRSYWRCRLSHMNVTAAVESKDDKSLVTITQSSCANAKESQKAKSYWKELLQRL